MIYQLLAYEFNLAHDWSFNIGFIHIYLYIYFTVYKLTFILFINLYLFHYSLFFFY